MKQQAVLRNLFLGAASILAGCANVAPPAPPDVPLALRPPAGQTVFLEALATGVQIYECASKPGVADSFQWTFRAPEAVLADRTGRPIGKHYAGPTWESVDGSWVKGEVKANDPGPTPAAIPWLLLSAKSVAGNGVFGPTTSIQRVRTVGGVAPSATCAAGNAGQVERVPYTASYYFYRVTS